MDAIYISGNSFKVIEDKTAEFNAGRRVKLDCGLDGIKYATVVSSSYSSPYTTVTIDESDLTASLTDALYGVVQAGAIGSLPDHNHDGSEGSGGTVSGTTYSGIDDHTHAAYVSWDFGSSTISGTGDIYCNDIYTSSGTVYIGDLKLSTDGQNLLVNEEPIEATGGGGPTTFSGLSDTPDIYDDGKYLKSTVSGTEWAAIDTPTFSGTYVETDYETLELVVEYHLNDETLDVTISGILGDTDDRWVIESYLMAGSNDARLELHFNGDTTNYYQSYLGANNNSAVGAAEFAINHIHIGSAYANNYQVSISNLFLRSGQRRVVVANDTRYATASNEATNLSVTGSWSNTVDEVSSMRLSLTQTATGWIRVYKRSKISLPIYEPNYIDTNIYVNELVQEWVLDNAGIDQTFTWDGDVDDVIIFEAVNAEIPGTSNVKMRFNNDSSGNYGRAQLTQDGTALLASAAGSSSTELILTNSYDVVESSTSTFWLKNTGQIRTGFGTLATKRTDDADRWHTGTLSHFWGNTSDKITSFRLWTDNTDLTGTFRLYKRVNLQLPVISGTGGGGSTTFSGLSDTPNNYGLDGQYLQSTGSGTVWTTVSGGGGSDGWTYSDELATTSGTIVTFDNIPSGVTSIEVMLAGVGTSTNTKPAIIQIGDAGGIETSGYDISNELGSSTFHTTDGWRTVIDSIHLSAMTHYGCLKLRKFIPTQNLWLGDYLFMTSNGNNVRYGSGFKTLTGELTSVALTTSDGIATFTGG